MASHQTNDSTCSARQPSAAMPPRKQPRMRCSDRSATACRVPSEPSPITGADITTAMLMAISVTCGRSIQIQTCIMMTTAIAARMPCSIAGHCGPSRWRHPGDRRRRIGMPVHEEVGDDGRGRDADADFEDAVEGDVGHLQGIVQPLQQHQDRGDRAEQPGEPVRTDLHGDHAQHRAPRRGTG